jgi:hypothetical protein
MSEDTTFWTQWDTKNIVKPFRTEEDNHSWLRGSASGECRDLQSTLSNFFGWCAILVFDGLLPEPHNMRVLKVLFNLAHWHSLVKLLIHTNATLDLLSLAMTSLGRSLQDFREKTCTMFLTRELEWERAAHQWWHGKSTARGDNRSLGPTLKAFKNNAWKPEHLNLDTYTYHSLGDYVTTIWHFGTMDSYSTQPVSIHVEPSFGTVQSWMLEWTRALDVESVRATLTVWVNSSHSRSNQGKSKVTI